MYVTKELLEEQFRDDLLMRYLKEDKVGKKKLYPSFMDSVRVDITLSTQDVGKFINKHDATIRNYIRNPNLEKYIKPEKVGINNRFDYKGLYKIYLIQILLSLGKLIKDVEIILGYKPGISKGSRTQSNAIPAYSNHDNDGLREGMLRLLKHSSDRINLLESYNDLQTLKRDNDSNRIEILSLESEKREIEREIETRRLENKNQQLLSLALKKSINQKNTGLFAALFKKDEVDTDNAVKEALAQLDQNPNEFKERYKEDLKRIDDKIKLLEEEMKERNQIIAVKETQITKLEGLAQLKQTEHEDVNNIVTASLNLAEDEESN